MVADAAANLLSKCYIDAEVLRVSGAADLNQYAVDGAAEDQLELDLFLYRAARRSGARDRQRRRST